MEEDGSECYICTDPLCAGRLIVLACGHKFHDSCLFLEFAQQLRFNGHLLVCPYCRVNFHKSAREEFSAMFLIKNYGRQTNVNCRYPLKDYELGKCCVLIPNLERQCHKKVSKKCNKGERKEKEASNKETASIEQTASNKETASIEQTASNKETASIEQRASSEQAEIDFPDLQVKPFDRRRGGVFENIPAGWLLNDFHDLKNFFCHFHLKKSYRVQYILHPFYSFILGIE